jgi:hypothetical protein
LKAKTFVAGFFNGDIKIFDGKDKNHTELAHLTRVHENQITDILYLKSEVLQGRKFVISSSEQPYPDLKILEVCDKNKVKVIASVAEDLSDQVNGWNVLA